MGYPDVVTLDGKKVGKFIDFRPGPDGRLYLLVRKIKVLEGTAKTFKKEIDAHRYVRYLYKKAKADPKKYKPLLALLEDEGYDMLPLDDPRSEMLASTEQVVIFQRDSRWLPFPIVALLEQSPSQRSQLLELYTLYNAYLRGERPKLYEQLRIYQQIDEYNSKLINTLMYENDQLMRVASELAGVVNNLYKNMANLIAAMEFFHNLYETYRSQSEQKDKVIQKLMEFIPNTVELVERVRDEMNKALDISMEISAREWSTRQTIIEALQRYREQLSKLQEQLKAYESPRAVAERARAFAEAQVAKGGGEGGEAGGEEGGGAPEGGA